MAILIITLFVLVVVVSIAVASIMQSVNVNALEKFVQEKIKNTSLYEKIYQEEQEPELFTSTKAQEIVMNIGEAQVEFGQSLEALDVTKKEIDRCIEVYRSTKQLPVQFIPKEKPILRVIETQVNSK
ncbi:hypothetical protein L1077_23140 [Pseudoalteromonas luteoviolacea]|uniref:hypothetical protein n=1 Tax=Pseudoalteromonas luteoviolacea TaxID=43657 RepID=UPI001F34A309|nr:hypothetical protein [Pseudoalteromonas luteoviolacea]MCF6442326.1 hypothetical protein [Pseudoalteromonas luteoviolacea]